MKKKVKKIIGILLSLALMLSLMPCMSLTVYADGQKAYAAYDVTTNTNRIKSGDALTALQVNFNGKKWYIIADNSTAVNAGTVTLLAADDSFGTSAFNSSNSNAYNNSTVERLLYALTEGGDFASVKDAIVDTNLSDVGVDGAKLYLLDNTDLTNLNVPTDVRKFSTNWWLRTRGNSGCAAYFGPDGSTMYGSGAPVSNTYGVRPALKLDLSAVTFSSNTFTVKPYAAYNVTTYANKNKSGDALTALQVTFNGKKWYIIEDNSDSATEPSVTLLAADTSFGESRFDSDSPYSNHYNGSDIQKALKAYTDDGGSFYDVANAIEKVTLSDAENLKAQLYLLNKDEAEKVPENVRKFGNYWWWLRSPGSGTDDVSGFVAIVRHDNGLVFDEGKSVSSFGGGVRPALKLDLSAVTFSSNTFTVKPYAAYNVTTDANKTKSGNDLTALQVSFNERQWYIIEDNSSSATSGTVTLLSADTTFGTKKFDDDRNKYSTSQVKTYLDSMTGTGGAFAGVAEAIETVNLTTNQYNSTNVYETVNNVKLYLLSTEEAKSLPENVRKAEFTGENFSDNEWWLRSPGGIDLTHAAFVKGDVGNVDDDGYIVGYAFGVRPALKLNLSAVIFDSASNTFSCITSLGTGAIKNPTQPSAATDPWKGNYVYYGKYDGTPTKYRVLDKASSDFGVTGKSLLLDCDSVFYNAKFDEDGSPNSGAQKANEWAHSDVKNGLNGDSFLTKAGNFTAVESSAIAESIKAAESPGDGDGWSMLGYASLNGEKIFLLDAKEETRTSYGYSSTNIAATNRVKTGSYSERWLRSPHLSDDSKASIVTDSGLVTDLLVSKSFVGVSPAFNISLPSIIFSSLVSGTSGSEGAEYKLTLKDPGLSIVAGAVDNGNNKYLVSYDITDNSSSADPTQVSVVVTDGTWSTDSGWSEGANLLQYSKLEMNTFSLSGTGTFTLDGSITGTLGTDYHLYVLAEDKNGEKETDFASKPLEIKVIPSYLYSLNYDPGDGGTGSMASEKVSTKYEFIFPACGFTGIEGKSFDHWKMSGADGIYYPNGTVIIADNCAQNGVVTVTAHWKDFPAASVTTPPTAKTLIYNGSAQELVAAGTVTGGTMQYVIGTNTTTAPTDGWSADIPTATAAGTYYVWYMVKGDDDHSDYYSTAPVSVTIKSSSGGGGGYNPTPPTPPKPPTPPTPVEKYTTPSASENSIKVSAEIKEGTATLGEIKAEDIKKITDALGDKSENATLLIDLSGAKSEVNSLVLSTATMEVLAKAIEGNENLESVTIKLSNAEVVIDGLALAEIAKQAKGDSIKLVVEEAKDLSTAQKEALSDYDAVSVFSVYFESDGTMIHDFNGGTVILSVKFEPEDGRDPKHYHIYYLSGLGDMTRHLTRWIKGFLQFLTGHCSDFVIVYDEKLENETSKGDDWTETEYLPNGVTKDEDGSYSFYDPDLGTVPLSEEVLTGGLVHRMYNPNSGEHFYTVSDEERDILISAGWIYESEDGFTGPAASEDTFPVYRLYNPNGNDHHFTLDRGEAIGLKEAGWIYEGVVFYAYDFRNGIPVYRVYNPNSGHHFFTADKKEFDFLISLSWSDEGIAWYAVSDSI